jgi:serine/threonine protein kinase
MCAGKIFKISLSSMNSKEEMGYERELQILKECEHPFIIEYIEEFDYQNKLCIVTKLASGGDFEKYMRDRQFSEDEAMSYFAMLLLGLDFLHRKNIFHRDLKPGNILIDELRDGMKILKIGDFGISKMDIDTMKQTLTTFAFDTTVAYMAPEAVDKKEKLTSKVDMWALGVILY